MVSGQLLLVVRHRVSREAPFGANGDSEADFVRQSRQILTGNAVHLQHGLNLLESGRADIGEIRLDTSGNRAVNVVNIRVGISRGVSGRVRSRCNRRTKFELAERAAVVHIGQTEILEGAVIQKGINDFLHVVMIDVVFVRGTGGRFEAGESVFAVVHGLTNLRGNVMGRETAIGLEGAHGIKNCFLEGIGGRGSFH